MADEFLLSFLNDARSLVYGIFYAFEFFIGLFYVLGKSLSEMIITSFQFLWTLSSDVRVFLELLVTQFIEFEQQLFRGVLLLYYGAGKIIDAFYITFNDLVSFISHMTWSISQNVQNAYDVLLNSLLALKIIPHQVCTALSLIGEFFLSGCTQAFNMLSYTAYLIVWTPAYTAKYIYLGFLELIRIPPIVLASIPKSAYVGILVLFIMYFIYCRLSVRLLVSSIFKLFRRAFGLLGKIVQFIVGGLRNSQSIRTNNNVGAEAAGSDLKGICVVCQEHPVAYIANPCSHVSLCRDCVHQLVRMDNRCPMCRKVVDTFSRVYIS